MKNIISLATPPLNCAIHIIRMTGPDVFEIINKVSSKKIEKRPNTIKMTNLIDGKNIIDQVLLMLFVNPNSYTGEDLIEINCHGNILIVNEIINLLISKGCQMASKGEFTKFAFLNNKISISQAMAVNKIATTPSKLVKDISLSNLLGKSNNIFWDWKKKIFNIIGNLEVSIDYPEYEDVEEITLNKVIEEVIFIEKKCDEIIKNYLKYKFIFEGINVLILGKPNVGKSTLLNKLLNEDRAIVSEISGTTRDYIKEAFIHNGIKYNLIDTAGIRKTNNTIEKIGIDKTKDLIKIATIILYLVDGSKKIDKEDQLIFNQIKNKNHIVVKTKKDLGQFYNEIEGITIGKFDKPEIIFKEIERNLKLNNFQEDNIFISSQIELDFLYSIKAYCLEVLKAAKNQVPFDLIAETLKLLFEEIKKLLGISLDYTILDEIFDNFCLGK